MQLAVLRGDPALEFDAQSQWGNYYPMRRVAPGLSQGVWIADAQPLNGPAAVYSIPLTVPESQLSGDPASIYPTTVEGLAGFKIKVKPFKLKLKLGNPLKKLGNFYSKAGRTIERAAGRIGKGFEQYGGMILQSQAQRMGLMQPEPPPEMPPEQYPADAPADDYAQEAY